MRSKHDSRKRLRKLKDGGTNLFKKLAWCCIAGDKHFQWTKSQAPFCLQVWLALGHVMQTFPWSLQDPGRCHKCWDKNVILLPSSDNSPCSCLCSSSHSSCASVAALHPGRELRGLCLSSLTFWVVVVGKPKIKIGAFAGACACSSLFGENLQSTLTFLKRTNYSQPVFNMKFQVHGYLVTAPKTLLVAITHCQPQCSG